MTYVNHLKDLIPGGPLRQGAIYRQVGMDKVETSEIVGGKMVNTLA